ncbi:MAG: response regulator [Planctomycetes bacterium]|nr:response regulator [Planctomycetota bacterium]
MDTWHVLAVDSDEWLLGILSAMLAKQKCHVHTAGDGEEGLAIAQLQCPHLVIVDLALPKMDGGTLVKQLRSLPEFGFVPVIFMAPSDAVAERLGGYRLGADECLPKPFRTEELRGRVEETIRRGVTLEARTKARIHFSGAKSGHRFAGPLREVGLPSLLTLMEAMGKTGVLLLESPEGGGHGRLFLRDGRVVHANVDRLPEVVNEQAVYHMLAWPGGSYEFTAVDVALHEQMSLDATSLLMEGARLMDEGPKAGVGSLSRP